MLRAALVRSVRRRPTTTGAAVIAMVAALLMAAGASAPAIAATAAGVAKLTVATKTVPGAERVVLDFETADLTRPAITLDVDEQAVSLGESPYGLTAGLPVGDGTIDLVLSGADGLTVRVTATLVDGDGYVLASASQPVVLVAPTPTPSPSATPTSTPTASPAPTGAGTATLSPTPPPTPSPTASAQPAGVAATGGVLEPWLIVGSVLVVVAGVVLVALRRKAVQK